MPLSLLSSTTRYPVTFCKGIHGSDFYVRYIYIAAHIRYSYISHCEPAVFSMARGGVALPLRPPPPPPIITHRFSSLSLFWVGTHNGVPRDDGPERDILLKWYTSSSVRLWWCWQFSWKQYQKLLSLSLCRTIYIIQVFIFANPSRLTFHSTLSFPLKILLYYIYSAHVLLPNISFII